MLNIRYVHVGNDVTCLLTQDGKFIGAVRSSPGYAEPWAFAVDGSDQIIISTKAGEADGEHLDDLYRKCERALLGVGRVPAGAESGSTEHPAAEKGEGRIAPSQPAAPAREHDRSPALVDG